MSNRHKLIAGENLSTTIQVTYPPEFESHSKRVDFLNERGEKWTIGLYTPEFNDYDMDFDRLNLTFRLPNEVTIDGELTVQFLAYKPFEHIITPFDVVTFVIERGIMFGKRRAQDNPDLLVRSFEHSVWAVDTVRQAVADVREAEATANSASKTANKALRVSGTARDTANEAKERACVAEQKAAEAREASFNAEASAAAVQASADAVDASAALAASQATASNEAANTAKEQAAQSAESARIAEEKATAALESATMAEAQATASAQSASEAQASSLVAQQSVLVAEGYASKSAQAAEDAQAAADYAKEQSIKANASLDIAVAKATQAQEDAATAKELIADAKDAVLSAETALNEVKAQAVDIAESANVAENKAIAAEESARLASESAAASKQFSQTATTQATASSESATNAERSAEQANQRADIAQTMVLQANNAVTLSAQSASVAEAAALKANNIAVQIQGNQDRFLELSDTASRAAEKSAAHAEVAKERATAAVEIAGNAVEQATIAKQSAQNSADASMQSANRARASEEAANQLAEFARLSSESAAEAQNQATTSQEAATAAKLIAQEIMEAAHDSAQIVVAKQLANEALDKANYAVEKSHDTHELALELKDKILNFDFSNGTDSLQRNVWAFGNSATATSMLLTRLPDVKVGDMIINSASHDVGWGMYTVSRGAVVVVTELHEDTSQPWSFEWRGEIGRSEDMESLLSRFFTIGGGINNANAAIENGIYNLAAQMSNRPPIEADYSLFVMSYDFENVAQLAVPHLPNNHNSSNSLWLRTRRHNSWSVWREIGGNIGGGAYDTQSLQLENPKAELEFMIDTLMFWLFTQFFGVIDENEIKCHLACMPFEEKVAIIVEESQNLFRTMGLPEDWVFNYISPDYVPEPTQQMLNFIAPLTQFIFDRMLSAKFIQRIFGYRFINLGRISGDFRIKGCDWSSFYIHHISASSVHAFTRPAARPDISQSWTCCNNLLNGWPLHGIDLKFRYSRKRNRLIVEGRAICPSDHEHYDISIVYEGVCRWSSFLIFDTTSTGEPFTILHERMYNEFYDH